MNICKKFIFIFLIFLSLGVFAQQNLSVPLNDNVYFLLENASLRGILPTLPAAKPYTLSFVLDNLNTVLASDKLSEIEKEVFIKTYNRLAQNTPQKWYRTGYYTNKFDENVKLPITAGFTWTSEASINCNDPDFSHEHWADVYIKGDITKYFSYNFNIGGSLMDLSKSAFPNNSYVKNFDGYQFILSNFNSCFSISDLPAGGLRMLPELAFSAFDNKVKVKFSRTRRDWGYGDGNLMLSSTARPFLCLETEFNPISWFSTNFITGTLEYDVGHNLINKTEGTWGVTGNLKESSDIFQNMYSALAGIISYEYFYFGANGSVVWPKRLELGYMNSFMLPFLYQNMIGDFDNMQLGLFTGITIPTITHIYASIFMDELNVQVSNFLNKDRNMYAVQIGAKSPLPFWTSIFTFQYTKIEPYMYSHPLTETPWYSQKMDTTYINHGQPLGYFLNPNSDEFKIQLESNPLWYLSATLKYTLVRHGTTTGSGKVDGSSFIDNIDYTDRDGYQNAKEGDLYWKDFLHDGVYEWINSISLGGELNCRKWDIPITVGLTYTFSYTHHTLGTKDSLKNINNAEYQNKAGNYLTLSIKVY